MGGGAFLLTDVAEWVPGRHEVKSRLALVDALTLPEDGPPRVSVHVTDADRVEIARRLHEAWPDRVGWARATAVAPRVRSENQGRSRSVSTRMAAARVKPIVANPSAWDEPDRLHAGRFGAPAPLLAVHLGAGTAAKRWPVTHWKVLVGRFLADGWRVAVVGGVEDVETAAKLTPHHGMRDWTGWLSVSETTALLERADLFIGADSGPSHLAASAGIPSVILFSGTNRVAQWRPWSRRALVLKAVVPCRPCHEKVCPLADHPCMTGIPPDRVYRAANRWWARLHRRESPHAPL
jgi:hypothetical protein